MIDVFSIPLPQHPASPPPGPSADTVWGNPLYKLGKLNLKGSPAGRPARSPTRSPLSADQRLGDGGGSLDMASADLSSPDTSTYPTRTLSDVLDVGEKETRGVAIHVDATAAEEA